MPATRQENLTEELLNVLTLKFTLGVGDTQTVSLDRVTGKLHRREMHAKLRGFGSATLLVRSPGRLEE